MIRRAPAPTRADPRSAAPRRPARPPRHEPAPRPGAVPRPGVSRPRDPRPGRPPSYAIELTPDLTAGPGGWCSGRRCAPATQVARWPRVRPAGPARHEPDRRRRAGRPARHDVRGRRSRASRRVVLSDGRRIARARDPGVPPPWRVAIARRPEAAGGRRAARRRRPRLVPSEDPHGSCGRRRRRREPAARRCAIRAGRMRVPAPSASGSPASCRAPGARRRPPVLPELRDDRHLRRRGAATARRSCSTPTPRATRRRCCRAWPRAAPGSSTPGA